MATLSGFGPVPMSVCIGLSIELQNTNISPLAQEISANNRTKWPTKGGSLLLSDSHPWAMTYVNIGLGNNVTSFNVSLLNHFNQTSNGTLCIPALSSPDFVDMGVKSGDNASIQVVTINPEGNALYNV